MLPSFLLLLELCQIKIIIRKAFNLNAFWLQALTAPDSVTAFSSAGIRLLPIALLSPRSCIDLFEILDRHSKFWHESKVHRSYNQQELYSPPISDGRLLWPKHGFLVYFHPLLFHDYSILKRKNSNDFFEKYLQVSLSYRWRY
jgi:hypothetical protein